MAETDGSGTRDQVDLPYEWKQFRKRMESIACDKELMGYQSLLCIVSGPIDAPLKYHDHHVFPPGKYWETVRTQRPEKNALGHHLVRRSLLDPPGFFRGYFYSVMGSERFLRAMVNLQAEELTLKHSVMDAMAKAVYRCRPSLVRIWSPGDSETHVPSTWLRDSLQDCHEWIVIELCKPFSLICDLFPTIYQVTTERPGLKRYLESAVEHLTDLSEGFHRAARAETPAAEFGRIWSDATLLIDEIMKTLLKRLEVMAAKTDDLVHRACEEIGATDVVKGKVNWRYLLFASSHSPEADRSVTDAAEKLGAELVKDWPPDRCDIMANLLDELAGSLRAALPVEESDTGQADGTADRAALLQEKDVVEGTWTSPMSKQELARRYVNDKSVRWRAIKGQFPTDFIRQVTDRKFLFRVDHLDDAAVQRCLKGID